MKYSVILFFLLSSIAIFPPITLAKDATQAVSPLSEFRTKEAPYLRTREVSTRQVQMKGKLISTMGPISVRGFQLHTDHESPYLWVRRLRVDIIDEQNEVDSIEFLCHAWVKASIGDAGKSDLTYPPLNLTISPGMEEMQFPDGFAARFDNKTISRVSFLAQAVNNNDPNIDKKLHFRATIDYLDDAAAQELGVKPLTDYNFSAAHDVAIVKGHGHQHGTDHLTKPGDKFDHWAVPPGKQVLRSEIPSADIPADASVHFIKVHLHPYGRSITLWDKTEQREVWTGRAENHPDRAFLTNTEFYSSSTGFPIYKDHEYELITIYDNPTDEDVDAMGVLRLFVHAPGLHMANAYASDTPDTH